MLRIVTDTASDITLEEAKKLNISIVPLKIQFEDGEYLQETEEDFRIFYDRLVKAKELPKTSQPSPESYLSIFEKAKEEGDDVLVLTLSSGLSGTLAAAELAKSLSEYERVFVVDSKQAIIPQRILVEEAVKMRDQGKYTADIVAAMEDLRDRITVCGVLDTLTYLKKGGRIPAALAVVGNALHIKPVIVLEDKILKVLAKVRGRQAGKKSLWKRFEQDPLDPAFPVYFGYTSDKAMVEQFVEETTEHYQLTSTRLLPVGGVIGTHVGTSCIAIAFVRK